MRWSGTYSRTPDEVYEFEAEIEPGQYRFEIHGVEIEAIQEEIRVGLYTALDNFYQMFPHKKPTPWRINIFAKHIEK